jgi:Na+-driven multidrug efflux pump
MFTILPASGVANAAATMVGQALGARKPERAEQAVKIAGKYNMLVLTGVGLLLGLGAPLIARLFTSDPAVGSVATNLLRVVAFGYPLYGWGMVYGQSFNGAGDTRTPTLLNLAVFWCWEIPLAFVLAIPLHLGPFGVFLAMALAFSTYALAGRWAFKRGTWKRRRI